MFGTPFTSPFDRTNAVRLDTSPEPGSSRNVDSRHSFSG
jgi:hypothetical protein